MLSMWTRHTQTSIQSVHSSTNTTVYKLHNTTCIYMCRCYSPSMLQYKNANKSLHMKYTHVLLLLYMYMYRTSSWSTCTFRRTHLQQLSLTLPLEGTVSLLIRGTQLPLVVFELLQFTQLGTTRAGGITGIHWHVHVRTQYNSEGKVRIHVGSNIQRSVSFTTSANIINPLLGTLRYGSGYQS